MKVFCQLTHQACPLHLLLTGNLVILSGPAMHMMLYLHTVNSTEASLSNILGFLAHT